MDTSKHGFSIPDYEDVTDIPALIRHNIEVLEQLLAQNSHSGTSDTVIDGGGYDDISGAVMDGGTF